MLPRISEHRHGAGGLAPARVILIASALALALKLFVLDLVTVRGDSMHPTVRTGALAVIAPIAYGIRNPFGRGFLLRWAGPREGQLVVADLGPSGTVIKRVFETGPAWLEAEAGLLCSRASSVPLGPDARLRFARGLYLEPERLFLVGDNPARSLDSRDYGSVPLSAVRARVVLVLGSGAGGLR